MFCETRLDTLGKIDSLVASQLTRALDVPSVGAFFGLKEPGSRLAL